MLQGIISEKMSATRGRSLASLISCVATGNSREMSAIGDIMHCLFSVETPVVLRLRWDPWVTAGTF